MKLLHRFTALILSALLLLSCAAAQDAGESARSLYELGLFQGTIAGRSDEESMALGRTATRAEALVMFLRLLGREEATQSGGWTHPFTDVDGWAAPYVGYAYQNGLTAGVSADTFGAGRHIGLREYMTFLLRALSYDDAAGDFSWESAADWGVTLGLYDNAFLSRCQEAMTRGDLAAVSYAALSLPHKEGTHTLAGDLADAGAVSAAAFEALGIPLDTSEAPDTPAAPEDGGNQEPDPALQIQAVVDLVNEARAAEGLDPLTLDEDLTAFAMVRAAELEDSFSHTRPDGRKCFSILDDGNYPYWQAGENIASGYRSPESVTNGWLNSPGHRANIMNENFHRIGVGVAGSGWVQLFSD